MPQAVTMSSKNQIVIPSEAREKLHLSGGAQLLVLCKEDRIVLIPKPSDFTDKLKGLHKDVWTTPAAQDYLQKEREGWQ